MKLASNLRLLTDGTLSAADARAVLDIARALRGGEPAGLGAPLRGKHVAVLCRDPQCETARVFHEAAAALGAHVSRVDPEAVGLAARAPALQSGADAPADGDEMRNSLRMLGRLYDAVECDELPAGTAARLQRAIGVPVFDGLARDGHPLMQLGAALAGASPGDAPALPSDSDRRRLVQAMLIHSIG